MKKEINQKIENIINDRAHGASWLSREAVDAMNFAVDRSEATTINDFLEEFKTIATKVIKARPSMTSIANNIYLYAYYVIEKSKYDKDLDSLKSTALSKGREINKQSEEASHRAAEHGANLISDNDTIMTCSYSSTLCQALIYAGQKSKKFNLLAAESMSGSGKSYGEYTAQQLKPHGILTEVVPDHSINSYINQTTKVLVGADSILLNGSLINGTPTKSLAVLAEKAGISFYSICETSKFDIQKKAGEKPELEDGFDHVPSNFITGIVTEDGVLGTSEIINYEERLSEAFRGLSGFLT
jgi:translation initiation factor eIF-2B subunit delta